jgi:PKD repeat protein
LAGDASTPLAFTWTPTSTGRYLLFARADRDQQVNEFDEGNNGVWREVYVGLRGPILIDSGAANDAPYTPALGYGYLDTGQPDEVVQCGAQPYETLRRDPDGQVAYRFDHLLPGHFYHLDVTLYECDGAGRQESIQVDGNLIAGPQALIDGRVHGLSLRLDPALYADRTISVTIAAPGSGGAVIAAINLYDVDYRYADAGSAAEPQYPGGALAPLGQTYGWLNGQTDSTWGTLPYQTVRIAPTTNTVYYRFDGLLPTKQYQIKLAFWQPSGAAHVLKVQFDDVGTGMVDTGAPVNTGDYQRHTLTVNVPSSAYQADGSLIVGITRTNAATGAFVNEIALEERTALLPPATGFTAAPRSGYAPLPVQFTDQSSGPITSWWWDFGDGAVSSLPAPLHAYRFSDTYTVSLQTIGPGGADILTRSNFITVTDITTQTVMRLQPAAATTSVGVPVTLAVAISNVTNLGSFQFTLNYDPSIVTVQAVTLGEFPGSTGRTFNPLGPAIDNVNGTATFGASSLGDTPPGANGAGNLAYLRLMPQRSETALLHLSAAQAADVSGSNLALIEQDGLLSSGYRVYLPLILYEIVPE